MNSYNTMLEDKTNTQEIQKKLAESITPLNGTTSEQEIRRLQAGYNMIQGINRAAEQDMLPNEQFVAKVKEEKNRPIIEKRDKDIQITKDILKKPVDKNHEKHLQRIKEKRQETPTQEQLTSLKSLEMQLQYCELSDKDWMLEHEKYIGNCTAEKIFIGMAKKHNVVMYPANDLDKTEERENQYYEMLVNCINHLNDLDDNILAMSVFSALEHPDSPFGQLIRERDSDIASIIPAPQKNTLKDLEDAYQHAYDADDFRVSARIKIFMEKNASALASPNGIKDELLKEAEQLVIQGMNAKKGN